MPRCGCGSPDAATCAPCVRACACQHCKCSHISLLHLQLLLPLTLLFVPFCICRCLFTVKAQPSVTHKAPQGRSGRGIPAALLRSICDHFHITFTPPPSLFLLQQLALVCLHMSPSSASAAAAASISVHSPRCACAACVRFPFGFSIFRLPLRVLSLFFYFASTSLNGLPCVGAHSAQDSVASQTRRELCL